MPSKKIKTTFETLNEKNVNEFTKKKGAFTYLSWAWAVRELLSVAPDATWITHEYQLDEYTTAPYMKTPTGYYVKVTVTIDGVNRSQTHPVLDNRNKSIDEPTNFQINTSTQRCLAKAIALHGLGLYIYAGEDLPVDDPLTSDEIKHLLSLAEATGDESKITSIAGMIDSGQINRTNYDGSLKKLERLAKEKVTDKSAKEDK